MNTKNNLENEKLPLNEDQSVTKLDSQTESTELNSEKVQEDQDEIEKEPLVDEEPVDESTEQLVEKESGTETIESMKEEASVSETSEPVVAEPVVEPEPVVETVPAKETEPASKETEPASKEQDESEIDYDLEDANNDDSDDDENDDDIDEHTVSDDSSAVLMPIVDIVDQLRKLLEKGSLQRKNVEEYKNQFYRSLRNEIESQKQAFKADGGEEIDFVAKEPDVYTEGKELLLKIKEKRAELVAEEDAIKEKNLARKLAIINQIKLLTETQGHEDFNKTYQDFKALQQEWSEIKLIPQSKVNELWKSYQRYVEKFYDLVRINNEFREYDFKKNLELKTDLCVAAEKLDEETDVVSAFHQLQNLHQEWREIGPVSRKDREEIWNRFKSASTTINKKYQSHFEELREKEDENLELKTAICEKLEAIDYTKIKTIKDWNRYVKEVLEFHTQ